MSTVGQLSVMPVGATTLKTTLIVRCADGPIALPVRMRAPSTVGVFAQWRKLGIVKDEPNKYIGITTVDQLGTQPGDVVQTFSDDGAIVKIEHEWS